MYRKGYTETTYAGKYKSIFLFHGHHPLEDENGPSNNQIMNMKRGIDLRMRKSFENPEIMILFTFITVLQINPRYNLISLGLI